MLLDLAKTIGGLLDRARTPETHTLLQSALRALELERHHSGCPDHIRKLLNGHIFAWHSSCWLDTSLKASWGIFAPLFVNRVQWKALWILEVRFKIFWWSYSCHLHNYFKRANPLVGVGQLVEVNLREWLFETIHMKKEWEWMHVDYLCYPSGQQS